MHATLYQYFEKKKKSPYLWSVGNRFNKVFMNVLCLNYMTREIQSFQTHD